MPKPATLPVLDWKAIYQSGVTFNQWLRRKESPENCKAMRKLLAEQDIEAQEGALLTGLPRKVHVVIIAEDWCGDVVQHVPVLERLAKETPKLQTRYITREQHPDVFVRFLTNGGEAIPKFIFLSDQYVECGNWGPMPKDCRKLIARGKACGDVGAARQKVAAMYEADSDRRVVVTELLELIQTAVCKQP